MTLETVTLPLSEAAVWAGITEDDLQWLIDTRQLLAITIRGKQLVFRRDLEDVLKVYKRVQNRGSEKWEKAKTT